MGGGSPSAPVECLTQAERAQVAEALADYQRRFGPLSAGDGRVTPEKFSFYPMGGTLYGDLFTNNFVDLDPTGGILDWDCTDYTYNGHDASDVDLRSFGEQVIGVPIFAALDGTVSATNDGEDDMHTSCIGVANYVIIDHGKGRVCRYWHMKKNSVQVSVGQNVKAGEQIGLAGSSGCSTYPHLHFATYDNGVLVEPYAGPCRPGSSEWTDQTPIQRDLYLRDLNITDVDIGIYPGLPVDMPRTGTFLTGVQGVKFWVMPNNLPASSTWRIRFRRPGNSIAFDSGTVGFGNSFLRSSWWWWWWNVNLNQTGTWHVLFEINGAVLVEAPFDVVSSPGDIVNRPPNPITVSIEPALPNEGDVLICRVNTDLVLDDSDYDIVRYHYVWAVDTQVVRDVITAAHSDVIPHHTGTAGSLVKCTVTPSDGTEEGTPESASATIRGTAIPTVSEWGMVAMALLILLAGTLLFARHRQREA